MTPSASTSSAPSTSSISSTTIPTEPLASASPASFPTLVGIHFRLIVRTFPTAHIIVALLGLGLLAAAFLGSATPPTPTAEGPAILPSTLDHLVGLLFTVLGFAAVGAMVWPEVVWRRLPPGRREALDAWPADRRTNRLARIVAGGIPPLALFGLSALALSVVIARVGGSGETSVVASSLLQDASWGLAEFALGLIVMTAAYLGGSAIGLRFGRPFLVLLLGSLLLIPVPAFLLMALGAGPWADAWLALVAHPWSPVELTTAIPRASLNGARGAILPSLAWLLLLAGACVQMAGAHAPSR